MDPANARVYEARANAYIKLEQFPDANSDATKALELSPGLAKAYLRKGYVRCGGLCSPAF